MLCSAPTRLTAMTRNILCRNKHMLPQGHQTLNQVYATGDNPKGPLYHNQPLLPHLPVPTLTETCTKYLQTLKPLVTDEEYLISERNVADFLKSGGIGEKLQAKLLEKAKKDPKGWLIDWWNELAYFSYRDPVVVYVSYFFQFIDDKRVTSQTQRAASLIKAAMEFRKLAVSEQLEPEKAKGQALCSIMYKFLFNSCRIPLIPSDTTVAFEPQKNNHLLVIRKNKFFVFDLVDEKGNILSTPDIEKQLKKIIKIADNGIVDPIGALSSENRDVWAKVIETIQVINKARELLISVGGDNEANLTTIASSVFAVCLDDTAPVTREEVGRALWVGDGKNRFYDKSCQFIVFENGKAGFMGEHSVMDATPTSRLCDWMLDTLFKNRIDHGQSSAQDRPVKQLEFKVNSEIKKYIQDAQVHFKQHVDKHQTAVLAFFNYGKDFIKKIKQSPDAYFQMAMQLAYYKMYGTCKATYESSQTRKFAYGRTEVTRSLSVHSMAWVKAMESQAISNEKKVQLLKKAIEAHTAYMTDACEGKGVDRHFLGLKMIANEMKIEKPPIFTDSSFAKSCHWNLSTSQIASEYYDNYGWSEVVPDGYGLPYMIKEKSLHLQVCSQHLHSDRFVHYMNEALLEMRQIFEDTLAIEKPKL